LPTVTLTLFEKVSNFEQSYHAGHAYRHVTVVRGL